MKPEPRKMKQSLHLKVCVIFFVFLIFSSTLSANREETKQGQEGSKPNLLTSQVSDMPMEEDDTDSINKLMGMETCEEDDEECLRRRMMVDAHLDYIYTQHHKN